MVIIIFYNISLCYANINLAEFDNRTSASVAVRGRMITEHALGFSSSSWRSSTIGHRLMFRVWRRGGKQQKENKRKQHNKNILHISVLLV